MHQFSIMKKLKCIRLPRMSVIDQLLIEESLFRTAAESYFLQNHAGFEGGKLIVLGISGKPQELVYHQNAYKDNMPMIRRFTGGGTVFIDTNVLMNSFIVSKDYLPCESFPKPTMNWTGQVYKRFFGPRFGTHQNDYIHILDPSDETKFLKVGGNAQSFSRLRTVHHTSFLLHVDNTSMHRYLKNPKRQPEYRAQRDHSSFLQGIREAFPETCHDGVSEEKIFDGILEAVQSEAEDRGFEVEHISWSEQLRRELRDRARDYINGVSASPNMRMTFFVDENRDRLADDFTGQLWDM